MPAEKPATALCQCCCIGRRPGLFSATPTDPRATYQCSRKGLALVQTPPGCRPDDFAPGFCCSRIDGYSHSSETIGGGRAAESLHQRYQPGELRLAGWQFRAILCNSRSSSACARGDGQPWI